MLILAYVRLFLDMIFKLCILALVQKPFENCFLNLLVIFFLKELIVEKLHRSEHKEFSTSLTCIESTDRSVCWETDWTTWENGYRGAEYIQSCSVRIDKPKSTILISLYKIFMISSNLSSVFTSLLSGLLRLAFSDTYQVLIQNTVSNEALLWVQVLVEMFSDNWVVINTYTNLFKEGINVSIKSAFASFLHNYQGAAPTLDVVLDVLQLMACERLARPS